MPGVLPLASAGTRALERASPLSWYLYFYCPGSVSLCNPLGFVFGEGWVPPSRSPRRMGTRRCGAAARGAGWARSFAARARRWHRHGSGAGRVPRCLSGSLVLSPPLPRCAHTRTLTHTRAHTEGEGCPRSRAGLRNFARPSMLRDSSGRHSPVLVLSSAGPAPLHPIGHSPARSPRRPRLLPPMAGATLVTAASEAVGGRWASPAAEAQRRGRPPPNSFLFIYFPFWSHLGRRRRNHSKRQPRNRWGWGQVWK